MVYYQFKLNKISITIMAVESYTSVIVELKTLQIYYNHDKKFNDTK